MPNVTKPGVKLSNAALLVVIGVLGAAILLDGTLYNKPQTQSAIHPLGDPQTIEIQVNNKKVLGFNKVNNQWQQTLPVTAPALPQRLKPLLETNRYNSRSYALSDIPAAEIFTDAITLTINQAEFHFGSIEPVSKLRFVRSGEKAYLQPDTVLPMLSAASSVFIDLGITEEVDRITINNTLQNADAWSNLKAIDIIENSATDSRRQSLTINLLQNNRKSQLIAAHTDDGYTITRDNGFTYLLDPATAESLGLAELLP